MNRNIFLKVALAGLIVGTLDILAAMLHYFTITGKSGLGVLNFIASGVFGKVAFTGGNSMMLFGLLFHYSIALAFTFFFFWIAVNVPAVLKYKLLAGASYAIFIWLVMQLIVVPLSNTPNVPFDVATALIGLAILVFCIGIPLSFFAAKLKVSAH